MSVKPPKCKNCGVEEWQHVCTGYNKRDRPDRVEPTFASSDVTGPVTKAVTIKHSRPTLVTKDVTLVTPDVTSELPVTKDVTPCKECERLKLALKLATDEVARLKERLADVGKAPMSAAERKRRSREAKRMAANGTTKGNEA